MLSPVGMQTWEEQVKWRLNPDTVARYVDLEQRMQALPRIQRAERGDHGDSEAFGRCHD